MAANRVDPIFAELNDVDTAIVVMRTASGTLCHINNSRRTNTATTKGSRRSAAAG